MDTWNPLGLNNAGLAVWIQVTDAALRVGATQGSVTIEMPQC